MRKLASPSADQFMPMDLYEGLCNLLRSFNFCCGLCLGVDRPRAARGRSMKACVTHSDLLNFVGGCAGVSIDQRRPVAVILKALACLILCVWLPGTAMARSALIKNIVIETAPLSVAFDVTGKVPVKVIQLSDKEVLVALKNVTLGRGVKVRGKNNPALASVNVESLDGNVLAVMVTTKRACGKINSSFNAENTRFTVMLEKGPTRAANRPLKKTVKPLPVANNVQPDLAISTAKIKPVSPKVDTSKRNILPSPTPGAASERPSIPLPEPQIDTRQKVVPNGKVAGKFAPTAKGNKSTKVPLVYEPPQRTHSAFKGDIGDIYRGEDPMGCGSKVLDRALVLLKKALFNDAYKLLDRYLFQENSACLEQVSFLKAYAYYKSIADDDDTKLITAQRMFQDALVSYSKSVYRPFAYAAMGIIGFRLQNSAAAQGYLNIVQKVYPDYTGMPEVEYYLARIYDENGYIDKAMRLYKKVFQSPVDNSYITDAGLGYGKALFKKHRYFDALSVLNYVVKNDIKKVYETSDLLLYIGDASFELGMSKSARDNYIRLLNLFPDIPNRDMLLSKVGDAFGMENRDEKAMEIYELVREKFPDTPGYINASIGIARYLKTDPEKIEIYQMVKNRFPDHTYARIAMMRLAEIYKKQGEYDKCIQEIEELLSTHPRGLRYEAVKLMQEAYEALFKDQLKHDEYTSVLNRYERESVKLDRMSSRLIAYQVGMAYLEADLYEEAFNQLISAYKRYKRHKRPPMLLYGLGKAMDESGRDEDALKLLTAFVKKFPGNDARADALTRMGQIYVEKDASAKADAQFKKAYAAAKSDYQRAGILTAHAKLYKKTGNLTKAADLIGKAAKAYAAAKGNHYQALTTSYKALGDTCLAMKSYVRAAQAYAKALDFSKGDRVRANIGFLLGDAYQKGNVLDKAKQTFAHVAQTYDSVWARLAKQRLTSLELADQMINS